MHATIRPCQCGDACRVIQILIRPWCPQCAFAEKNGQMVKITVILRVKQSGPLFRRTVCTSLIIGVGVHGMERSNVSCFYKEVSFLHVSSQDGKCKAGSVV